MAASQDIVFPVVERKLREGESKQAERIQAPCVKGHGAHFSQAAGTAHKGIQYSQ